MYSERIFNKWCNIGSYGEYRNIYSGDFKKDIINEDPNGAKIPKTPDIVIKAQTLNKSVYSTIESEIMSSDSEFENSNVKTQPSNLIE